MSMKNPLTPAGIEPATFRIVAQHLNHCATAVPIFMYVCMYVNDLVLFFVLGSIYVLGRNRFKRHKRD